MNFNNWVFKSNVTLIRNFPEVLPYDKSMPVPVMGVNWKSTHSITLIMILSVLGFIL